MDEREFSSSDFAFCVRRERATIPCTRHRKTFRSTKGFVQTLELDFLLIRRGSQWVTFRSSLGMFLGAQRHKHRGDHLIKN